MTPPPTGTPAYVWLLAIVIPAVTTALAGVVVALINRPVRKKLDAAEKKLGAVAADAREARDQTANTHTTNLREDLDEKFAEVLTAVSEVKDVQREHGRDIGGLRADHRQTRTELGHLREVVDGNASESRRQHTALARRLERHLNPGEDPDDPA